VLQNPIFKYAAGHYSNLGPAVPWVGSVPQQVWYFDQDGPKIYPEPKPDERVEVKQEPKLNESLWPFWRGGTKLRFKASGRTAVVVEPQDFGRTILIEWSNGERSDVNLNDLKDAAEVVE
jgi:hypothetical protein